jgi:cytoskeleton-associated protein 2
MQLDETNSALKDLKFLTPVRRSRRLQEKTSKLPDMLKDHYPCVSSLEQLSELGGETDAFVCRPNAALCPMFSETDTTEEIKLP